MNSLFALALCLVAALLSGCNRHRPASCVVEYSPERTRIRVAVLICTSEGNFAVVEANRERFFLEDLEMVSCCLRDGMNTGEKVEVWVPEYGSTIYSFEYPGKGKTPLELEAMPQ